MIVDPDEINLTSPYKVYRGKEGTSVVFLSENEVRYKVAFYQDTVLFDGLTVSYFSLSSPDWSSRSKHMSDPNIRETVFQIMKNFLTRNDQALLYICEGNDGRARYRHKLFDLWFSQVDKALEGQFSKYSVEHHAEGTSVYGGMVCRSDNPLHGQYVDEFNRYSELLRK